MMTIIPPLPAETSLASFLVLSALLAHQIFRKFEIFCLPLHAFLLLVPPAIAASCPVPVGIESTACRQVAFCYATYLGALASSVVSYRLSTLHPLHRYPGPHLCRISMFWHAFHMIGGKQMRYLKSLHDTYGDIVRIGPNHLSIRDASLVGHILGPAGIPKGPSYVGATMSEAEVPFIGIQNVEEHGRRRRPWTRGLGPTALKGYEHVISGRVYQMVGMLEQRCGGPVSLGDWIRYLTYDFMSDIVLGGGSEQLQNGDNGAVWTVVGKGSQIATFFGQIPWLGVYLGHIPGITGSLTVLLEYARKATTKRLAEGSSSRDLFYYLRNEDLPDEAPPPTRVLLNDGIVAMAAATETTSTALISIFHCILTNPETYAALQEEVDRFYPQWEDVCSTANHRDMHYLTAVIHETLRLFPPVPTNSSRQVPHGSAPVVLPGSLVIPQGTQVYIPPHVLHHDARNFVFPDAFWPERWLVASGRLPLQHARAPTGGDAVPKLTFVHNEATFTPFSHGPMSCAGKGLAMQQMRVVVCALVRRFRIRLDVEDGHDMGGYLEAFKESYLFANRAELPVVLEPRW